MLSLSLTPRDTQTLQALVQKVRLFGLRQIAAHWWRNDVANARRRLRQYQDAGLVHRIDVQARPLPELQQPLMAWQPSDMPPDFEAIAYRLQVRWRGTCVRPCSAFIATERLCHHYGGRNRGELKRPLQATHDLGVAQVWLTLHDRAPEWAAAWRSEDLLAATRRGEKCPDAFVVNSAQEVGCVIEFGGAYAASRVREFHDDCAARGLPYQLW
jgi:hypothetical protein